MNWFSTVLDRLKNEWFHFVSEEISSKNKIDKDLPRYFSFSWGYYQTTSETITDSTIIEYAVDIYGETIANSTSTINLHPYVHTKINCELPLDTKNRMRIIKT